MDNRNRPYKADGPTYPLGISGVSMFWHHGLIIEQSMVVQDVTESVASAAISAVTTSPTWIANVSDRASLNLNGTTQFYGCSSRTRANLFDDSGYDFFLVAMVKSYAATSGFWYLDPCLFADDSFGIMGLSISSTAITWTQYDGTFPQTSHATVAVNTPFLFHARFSSGTVSTRINAGTAQTVSSGSMVSGAPFNYQNATFKWGRNYLGGSSPPGVQADAAISACVCAKTISPGESNDIRAWIGRQYALPV